MKTRLLALILVWLTPGCVLQVNPATPTPIPGVASTPTRVITPPARAPSAPLIVQRFPLREMPGTGRNPSALAVLADRLHVLNVGSDNIAIVQKDRLTKFIPVPPHASALAADPSRNLLYVASRDKTISLVANDQITLTQDIGEEVETLLFFDGRLIVGSGSKGSILFLDPATLQIQSRVVIPGAFTVTNLAFDPIHHRIYANLFDRTAVIDSISLRVLTTIATTGSYRTLLAYPPNDTVMVSQFDSATQSQSLVAYDALSGTERGRSRLGGDPSAAILSADGTRVYVANSFTNDVMVFDPRTMTPVATIPVGLNPRALAIDDEAHRLYVANAGSDNLSVINADNNQWVMAIPVGMLPTTLAADENGGRVYVANASTDSVFLIEGARVVREIGVGRHPIDIARDEKSKRLLVANEADRTLSIVDESDFNVRATLPITRYLTTVASDPPRGRVFANDVILDASGLKSIGQLTIQGMTLGSRIGPTFIRLNLNLNRIYAMGGNGIPGSNGRYVVYSVDGNTLKQRGILSCNYGNITALAIDPETNRVYSAETHPLAYVNDFCVWDGNDARLSSISMPARTTAIVYNPGTHHLFLAHASTSVPSYGPPRTPADNIVQILDANSLGEVARLGVDEPSRMTRLGDTIYVASYDGMITLIQDVNVPTPPSPTPTFTPTPYPTLPPLTAGPPLPTFPITPSPYRPTSTPRATLLPICSYPLASLASPRWTAQLASRLGCPTEDQHGADFAMQPFERGTMFWREDNRRILVLFADRTWAEFNDTWTDAQPEDSCPGINVAPGLVKPKRGFGKVWCEQSGVREGIGGATDVENGLYVAPVQHFEHGLMFESPRPQVFVLYAGGKWE